MNKIKNLTGNRLRYGNATDILEKTPVYALFPHISYIITNDFIKYGAKIIYLIRNPVKRLISNCWHSGQFVNGRQIPKYLDAIVYNDTFNKDNSIHSYRMDLQNMYHEYIQNKHILVQYFMNYI